jgi:hypothetical protein
MGLELRDFHDILGKRPKTTWQILAAMTRNLGPQCANSIGRDLGRHRDCSQLAAFSGGERMVTEKMACPACGQENHGDAPDCAACGASLAEQPQADRKGPAWSEQLQGRRLGFLIAGALIALAVVAIMWSSNARSHRASTYGFDDASSAALRVENRTTDFAIKRVFIEDADLLVGTQDEYGGIVAGAKEAFEIVPGSYQVKVFYVESSQVLAFRPEGSLSELVTVGPGEAAILRLEGGRSSPEGMIFIPPKLSVK